MTCYGHIRNGTIVLESVVELPEGVEVQVEVKPVGDDGRRVRDVAGLAEGIKYDFDALEEQRNASKL